MKPEIKKFTRDAPCTKRDIWNLFRGSRSFVSVRVPDAQAKIGVNVPRGMEAQGRLFVNRLPTGDYYVLTDEGKQWLTEGMGRYLKNHPTELAGTKYPLPLWVLRKPR
jgi:hypothetical protein